MRVQLRLAALVRGRRLLGPGEQQDAGDLRRQSRLRVAILERREQVVGQRQQAEQQQARAAHDAQRAPEAHASGDEQQRAEDHQVDEHLRRAERRPEGPAHQRIVTSSSALVG